MNNQTAMFTSEQQKGGQTLNMLDQINATEDRIKELRSTIHTFWEDPGHGWLEAQRSDLIMLGIANKISGFSYQSHEWNTKTGEQSEKVYLEEDCDASIYIEALWNNMLESAEFQTFRTQCLRSEYQENIFVRKLRHYEP